MRLLLTLMLLGGCATATADSTTREQRELASDLQGRTAGAARACVPIHQNGNLQIVDRQTLAYRDGDTIYVNRLGADCPGLQPSNTLLIEPHGSEYCSGDHVRGIETNSAVPGPFCVLRDFIPYPKVR